MNEIVVRPTLDVPLALSRHLCIIGLPAFEIRMHPMSAVFIVSAPVHDQASEASALRSELDLDQPAIERDTSPALRAAHQAEQEWTHALIEEAHLIAHRALPHVR
eukprot:3042729-Pleurochrysis_carterae.AAC.2